MIEKATFAYESPAMNRQNIIELEMAYQSIPTNIIVCNSNLSLMLLF